MYLSMILLPILPNLKFEGSETHLVLVVVLLVVLLSWSSEKTFMYDKHCSVVHSTNFAYIVAHLSSKSSELCYVHL